MKYLRLARLAKMSGISWLNFLTKTPASGEHQGEHWSQELPEGCRWKQKDGGVEVSKSRRWELWICIWVFASQRLAKELKVVHRKKRFTSFLSPAGMSLTKLPLSRNNSVMTSLFPPRESLVVTSRLGTGNSRTVFLRCTGTTPPLARKRKDDSQIYLHSTRGFSHG